MGKANLNAVKSTAFFKIFIWYFIWYLFIK